MFRKEIWESLLISPCENQFIAQQWSKRLLGIIRKRIESKQKKIAMLPHKFMMHLHPGYYAVNSSLQLRMESWKWPRKRKKQAQWTEWFLCEERQNILGIFSLGKRWSLITSWMVMGSWGKRLIIIPDNIRIRADEIISWAFKKGALHHPARGEVVQVMAMGYYGDQNNKWVPKLMGQICRG